MAQSSKAELYARVCRAIEESLPEVKALAASIWAEPELGFKETKTSQKVQDVFQQMGIPYTTGHALTGVKGVLAGKSSRRRIAMIGELDAILCGSHPAADPKTGAAHCCGHNVQVANMVAVGLGLQRSGVMEELAGDVVLFATPAEEFVEITYRQQLREQGVLRYLGGKQQLIFEGAFDDIDIAMQMHVFPKKSDVGEVNLGTTCNGFVGKLITYNGKASHAAMAPEEGVNALNACMMGVMGVNALRDTFRDTDCFRFHPIIKQGGDLVNVVPDKVTMESYVRAATVEAMRAANTKVDRALCAGADALGATCDIQNIPGYLPMAADTNLNNLLAQHAGSLFGTDHVHFDPHSPGSTEMGDVSTLLPIVHPWVGCVDGALHGADYEVVLEEVAYVKTAQALAMTIVDLLYDEAQTADAICDAFTPVFTKESYITFMDSLTDK